MDVDKRWVGAILRLTREYRGISREAMAKACGVTPGTVSHWETGRVLLNAAQLATWARLCGVDLDLLAREAGLQDTAADPPPVTTLRGFWRSRGRIQSGDTSASAGGDTPRAAEDNEPPTPRRGAVPPGSRYPRSPEPALVGAQERRTA